MHAEAFGEFPGAEPMQAPEAVAAMLRVKAPGVEGDSPNHSRSARRSGRPTV
jgi:hypothetical protein